MENRYGAPVEEFSGRMSFLSGMAVYTLYRSGEHVEGLQDLRDARRWLHQAWSVADDVALPGQTRTLQVMYFQYLAARRSADRIAAIIGHIIFEEFGQAADLLDDLITETEDAA